MAKTLQLFNGVAGHIARLVGAQPYRGARAYVAAYSRADAVRVMAEVQGDDGWGLEHELKKYYSPCWGNPMAGITPERGVWVSKDGRSPPVRLYPKVKDATV